MWLMASEIPVHLDILDQTGQRVTSVAARLTHLDETYALISLEEANSSARLHWGAPVRFELEDGMRRYEITGAIVARQEEEAESEPATNAVDEPPMPTWEVRIRIWECKLNVQRRTLPRRRLRFRVQLRDIVGQEEPEKRTDATLAWCVDIGAGGIRVRTNKLASVPPRMRLEFCLPITDGAHGAETTHNFCLTGRVIRSTPQGRHGDDLDIAFSFEGLTVRDGMALRSLLT